MNSLAEALSDEICLEGLDGITPEQLAARLEDRFGFPAFGPRLWDLVLRLEGCRFYVLPTPRPTVVPERRFLPSADGYVQNPEFEEPENLPFFRVENEFGSCEHFRTRRDVTDEADRIPFSDAIGKYKNSLVVVGGREARWSSLAGGVSLSAALDINESAYCALERIGRSRYNGQLTAGKGAFKSSEGEKYPMFYIRKMLLELGLIAKQIVSVDKKPTICVTLPRFYRKYAVQNTALLKSFFKTSKCAPYAELKRHLLSHMSNAKFKHFRKSDYFSKAVLFVGVRRSPFFKVPYREAYPDAPVSKWKYRCNSEEKKVNMVKYNRDGSDESDEEVEPSEDFGKFNIIGEPLLQQAFNCILNSGTDGITQGEIADKLGTDNLTARLACRYLLRSGLLYTITNDINRTVMTRYFSQIYKDKICQDFQNAQMKMETLFNSSDVKNKINNMSANGSDISEVETNNISVPNNTKLIATLDNTMDVDLAKNSSVSLKKLNRINMIMERVREKHVITNITELKHYIISKETQSKFKGVIDTRSIMRLLINLEKEGRLNVYKIKVKVHGSQVVLNFICEPSVDIKNPIIQSTIEETKDILYSRYKNSLIRGRNIPKPKFIATAGRAYGLLPKFSRMKLLHEFLFYIVYNHKNKIGHHGKELLHLIETENLDKDNFEVYEETFENCMFVPPIKEYLCHPKGWVMIKDIINCLPLVIFTKLININYHVKDLSEYLNHPLKSQFLLKNIPDSMKSELLYKNRDVIKLYDTILLLCCLGLLQIGENPLRSRDRIFIYINKYATLLDTTSSKESYYKVEEKKYPTEKFNFNTFQDVENYWNRSHTICSNTPLNSKYASIGEVVEIQRPAVKLAHILKEKSIDEALKDDFGLTPGDGLGAAGYDTVFFGHLPKNWDAPMYHMKSTKKKTLVRKEILVNYPRKKPLLSREISHKLDTAPIKRKSSPRRRILTKPKYSKVATPKIDEVDEKALRLLGKGKKTKWNVMENRIIQLAKIAISVMNSNENCILMRTVRDIIHKCFSSYDKSSFSCLRRIKYIMRHPLMSRNVNLQLTEIQRNPTILKMYQNMHKQFCVSNKVNNCSRRLDKFKIHFIELIQFLYTKIYYKNINKYTLCLPNSIDALHRNFTIEKPSDIKTEHETDDSIVEIQKGVLCSIVHSALACSFFKDKKYNMLPTYKMYPESIIRSTLLELRASGMISSRLVPDLKMNKTAKLTASLFKLSFNYIYNMAKWYKYKMYIQAGAYIKHLTDENFNLEELENLNSGTSAVLLDLFSMNYISLNLSIPENIITVNPKYLINNDQSESSNKDINIYPDIFDQTSVSSFGTLQLIEGKIHDSNDVYVINSCNLKSKLVCTRQELIDLIPNSEIVFRDIIMNAVCLEQNEIDFLHNTLSDSSQKLVEFILSKEDVGATGKEMLNYMSIYGTTKYEVKNILNDLCSKNIIRRVGIKQTRWICIKYRKHWFVDVKKIIDIKDESKEKECCITSEKEKTNPEDNIPHKKRKLNDEINLPHSSGEEINYVARDSVIIQKDNISKLEEKNSTMCIDEEESIQEIVKSPEAAEGLWTSETAPPEDSFGSGNNMNATIDSKIMTELYGNKNIYLSPRPWIKPDGLLNFQLLWRWIASILSFLSMNPMVCVVELQQRFKFMLPHHLNLLIEIMSKIGCVRLVRMKKYKATLWSNFNSNDNIIEEATGLEDDAELFVEILDGAILKYVLFKGNYFQNNS